MDGGFRSGFLYGLGFWLAAIVIIGIPTLAGAAFLIGRLIAYVTG